MAELLSTHHADNIDTLNSVSKYPDIIYTFPIRVQSIDMFYPLYSRQINAH